MGAEREQQHIEQHVFRYVEKELYKYPVNKKLVEAWEEERKGIIDERYITVEQAGDRRPQNKVNMPTEAKALRLEMMAAKVDRAKHYCSAIEDVVSLLRPEDKRLVELKYFQPYLTNSGVAKELCISDREFYHRRNKVVDMFGTRMGLL